MPERQRHKRRRVRDELDRQKRTKLYEIHTSATEHDRRSTRRHPAIQSLPADFVFM